VDIPDTVSRFAPGVHQYHTKMRRRSTFHLLPAAAAALLGELDLPGQGIPAVSVESLRMALSLAGLDFRDEHINQMLRGVERARAQFATLRSLPVPLDTDPPFAFQPLLPGMPNPANQPFVPPPASPPRAVRRLEEAAYWTIPDLAALIHARQVSCLDLTRMYLDRLRRHAPRLNCVVNYTEGRALDQARRLDAELSRGRYRGLLHGIPYGAKDLFATKGAPTTWGAEPFRNQLIPADATVIGRLDSAGAVLIAKLSMGALAMGGAWFGGMTRNPWNVSKSSSGSSAGSASATAAGLVPFALGTETLGSILTPSRICGVTGLRPTFGRVSRYGAMSLCWTLDKIGPICRSAEDAMIVLRAIHGPDGRDLSVSRQPLAWNAAQSPRALRVGFAAADFQKLSGARKAVAMQALEKLRTAGIELRPVAIPEFPVEALLPILSTEAAAAFDDLTRSNAVDQLGGQSDGDWPNLFRTARLTPAVEYLRAMRARTLLMRRMAELFRRWDVLVSPSSSSLLTITNFTGHPQISVPAGLIDGEPEAIHFTGRLFEEGKMALVAHLFQTATAWHLQEPPAFAV
jgi:Asp-tRNA(Asn)/Glu-tRNA(Gln) amidotransferase A subunit family amidase